MVKSPSPDSGIHDFAECCSTPTTSITNEETEDIIHDNQSDSNSNYLLEQVDVQVSKI